MPGNLTCAFIVNNLVNFIHCHNVSIYKKDSYENKFAALGAHRHDSMFSSEKAACYRRVIPTAN
ncbi:hypothetical protein [Candidatus Nitrotoga sp. 1052]|uniref:hypothetical protein n=1 Tax=Candidatus Nitrotoga sp. 1052 TaxID=2886964 RepID=UPI001EF4F2DB|nr:hypothetical protein [Candidatus Nitrotoga sp. 1052]